MNLNTIQINGREFVLIPMANYKSKQKQFDKLVSSTENDDEYFPLILEEIFHHPVVLARMKAGVTQVQLAELMGVTQAYISQLEKTENVSNAVISKVKKALKDYPDVWAP